MKPTYIAILILSTILSGYLLWIIDSSVLLKILSFSLMLMLLVVFLYQKTTRDTYQQKINMQKESELAMLQDQLKGYKKIAKALREQKHEFQNKSHVILGLIRMNELEKASEYIMQNVYTTNLTSDYYLSRIKDDQISALLVGKEIQAVEQNIQIKMTNDSYISQHHQGISSDDLIVIIGNLIDNSIDAYHANKKTLGVIEVHLYEDDHQILIRVSDEAGGIKASVKEKIFERGVTTKPGDNRGTGLALVKSIIVYYKGTKKIESDKTGACISIMLPKQ